MKLSLFSMHYITTSPDFCFLSLLPPGAFPSWRTGEWNTCSVTCGGGSQTRRVECVSHDAAGPLVVEDAICAAYAEAPPTLQTCNMHKCAEYRATRWSAVSEQPDYRRGETDSNEINKQY